MKTIDLFRAYVLATRQAEYARDTRGFSRGILIATDSAALRFQRYSRLSHTLLQRVLCRLDPSLIEFYKDRNVCRKCGYQPSACSCAGGHAPVKHWDAWLGRENKALKDLLFDLMYPDVLQEDEWALLQERLGVLAPAVGMGKEFEEWRDHQLPF